MSDPKIVTPTFGRDLEYKEAGKVSETSGRYPTIRMRRNRTGDGVRRLVAENKLSVDDLIWTAFVVDGENQRVPGDSRPGVVRYSTDVIAEAANEAFELGVPAIALFPFTDPDKKTPDGRESLDPENLVCTAIRNIKAQVPDMMVVCDVALDPYTSHGHDGVMDGETILNDETLEILVKQAFNQAEAGCDTISPSDMMDGRVAATRAALDNAGYQNVQIMAYAAKYSSSFYGPFRDAVKVTASLGKFGKATYQMDPANSDEAMHEIALDLAEGADLVIIKPGMPYLDVLARAKAEFGVPCVAYQVSGEYAMQCAAFANGWLDRDRTILETMMAFRRAGADAVLTYFAPDIAKLLQQL